MFALPGCEDVELIMGFFVVLLLFAAIVVWQFIEGRKALATTSVITRYTPDQAVEAINGVFGGARSALWTTTSGPGMLNRRRRGVHRGITMSIDITPQGEGVTRIDMWASQYTVYLLVLVNFAGVVNRRKRAIGRLLAEPDTQQLASKLYGGNPAAAGAQPGTVPGAVSGPPSDFPATGQPYQRYDQ
jgi:hypothetical protein